MPLSCVHGATGRKLCEKNNLKKLKNSVDFYSKIRIIIIVRGKSKIKKC
jgi:hypothetical protein